MVNTASRCLTLPHAILSVQLEKAKAAFHKACRKEHTAREREAHAQGNPDIAIEKQRKIQDERQNAEQETQKVSVRS